jgi:hypothetical protein
MKCLALSVAFATGLMSTQALALPVPNTVPSGAPLIQKIDWECGPGYHLGRGGVRSWSDVPGGPSFAAPRKGGFAPSWGCPPGYHLGRGHKRCWPN